WDADESSLKNIDRLKSEDAVVVIGGQQAGLLTGPLYSINKVISIISLAKRQEAELNRPVIPVFWIAGEDHDFDEINHVNINTDFLITIENNDLDENKHLNNITKKSIKKHKNPTFPKKKKSVNQIDIDSELTKDWLTHIFLELEESTHSKIIYGELLNILKKS